MRVRRLALALATMLAVAGPARAADPPVRLLAAGSLRAALTEVVAAEGGGAQLVTGPSGLLRQRIAAGEASDVFASANLAHPRALADAKARPRPVVVFARNRLCALVRPGVAAESATLLDRMLDPAVRLGTSTPGADPSGDYAFALFRRAEALRPGARAALEAKALILTGGPDSPRPPEGRNTYAWLLETGAADIALTYCTNARAAVAALPGARSLEVPEALAVGADYGLIVLTDRPEAARLALFLLSPAGQAILARHGFDAPALPRFEATAR